MAENHKKRARLDLALSRSFYEAWNRKIPLQSYVALVHYPTESHSEISMLSIELS
jgi:hypothetical protein